MKTTFMCVHQTCRSSIMITICLVRVNKDEKIIMLVHVMDVKNTVFVDFTYSIFMEDMSGANILKAAMV